MTTAYLQTMYDEGYVGYMDSCLENNWTLNNFLKLVNENNSNQGDNNSQGGTSTYENIIGTWNWEGMDILGAAYGSSSRQFSITFYSNVSCSGCVAEYYNRIVTSLILFRRQAGHTLSMKIYYSCTGPKLKRSMTLIKKSGYIKM